MNIRHIRRAVGLIAKSSVSKLHLDDALGMTFIVRTQPRSTLFSSASPVLDSEVAVVATQTSLAPQPSSSSSRVVVSPMVGRFYSGARRDGERLVRGGEKVKAGQPVGSVDVMHLMYAIRADCAGTIEQVLMEDGEAVEYGQPLVRMP